MEATKKVIDEQTPLVGTNSEDDDDDEYYDDDNDEDNNDSDGEDKDGAAIEYEYWHDPYFLFFFNTMRVLAVVASIRMCVAQIVTVCILNESFFQDILRVYVCSFCLLFMLAELDWFQDKITFLQPWMYRGFMYTFVGVVGVEEASTVKVHEDKESHHLSETWVGKLGSAFVFGSSLAMFFIGCIYVLMGACRVRRVHTRLRSIRPGDDPGEVVGEEEQEKSKEENEVV